MRRQPDPGTDIAACAALATRAARTQGGQHRKPRHHAIAGEAELAPVRSEPWYTAPHAVAGKAWWRAVQGDPRDSVLPCIGLGRPS
jgi:hypothetical protein